MNKQGGYLAPESMFGFVFFNFIQENRRYYRRGLEWPGGLEKSQYANMQGVAIEGGVGKRPNML